MSSSDVINTYRATGKGYRCNISNICLISIHGVSIIWPKLSMERKNVKNSSLGEVKYSFRMNYSGIIEFHRALLSNLTDRINGLA